MNFKNLSILLLLLLVKLTSAQNYRNIPVNGNFYFIDSLNYIFPIDPDSIKFENGDSVIYHFKSIRPSKYIDTLNKYIPFYNLKGDSWAGSKTILKSDSVTIWFAKGGDSLVIKNQAKISDVWLVNGKRQTYGKVTDHLLKTFLGITDSVKYLSIGSLNTVTSEVVGKEFWLSKNYGFIKMQDIYNFYVASISGVDYSYSYPYTGPLGNITLFGSKLIAGTRTKLTERMVNDFNVGDEFQTNYYFDDSAPDCEFITNSSYSKLENLIIKSKIISTPLMDTIVYVAQSCGYRISSYTDFKTKNNSSTISFNTSITIKLPYRNIGDIPFKSYNTTYLNKFNLLQEDIFSPAFCIPNDTIQPICFSEISWYAHDIPCNNTIIEGVGYGYNDYVWTGGTICYDRNMYCLDYIKRHLYMGTPHSFICDTLTLRTILGINDNVLQKSITILPNPYYDNLTIQSTDRIQKVNFYNAQMQLVKTFNDLKEQEVSLNAAELALGMYIVEVILFDNRKAQYKVIKSD